MINNNLHNLPKMRNVGCDHTIYRNSSWSVLHIQYRNKTTKIVTNHFIDSKMEVGRHHHHLIILSFRCL